MRLVLRELSRYQLGTFADIIYRNAILYPDSEASVCGSERISFSCFNERVNRLIHGLHAQGIHKGDVIGMVRDAQFGPTIMFGMGGVFVELFREVGFRIAPFDEAVALDMIKESKAYRVLQDVRGEKQKDIASLAELLVQVSQLAARYPQIGEIDLNPIRVYESGYSVLDARILLDAE